MWLEEISKIVKSRFGDDVEPLGLIFYLDGTALGHNRRRNVKPLYLQLCIHSYKTRCLPYSRRLITYLNNPQVENLNGSIASQQSCNLQYYHSCLKVIMESIYKNLKGGILDIELPNNLGQRRFFPTIAMILADLPERKKLCNILDNWNTSCLYPVCVIL